MSSPAVSVITICRNARTALGKTRLSVEAQACRDFEWLVIDGNSSDGTVDDLRAAGNAWTRWVSEPDTGIYDAMNKGLRMATGRRVWFMNAGDCFAGADSLGKVAATPDDVDICFGEALVTGRDGAILGPRSSVTPHALPERLELNQFRMGMVVSHQAFVPLRDIAPVYQSDRYTLSADLDWMLTLLGEPRSSLNLGPLAVVEREGASMDAWGRSQRERFLILSRHFGYTKTILNHARIALRRIRHGRRTQYWK